MNLYVIGGVLIVLLGLAAWGSIERAERIAAMAEVREAQRVAAANEEAVRRISEDRAAQVAALTGLAHDIAAQAVRSVPIRRSINAAPTTAACASDPAIRALLDSLRTIDRGPGGAPEAAGRAAPVSRPADPAGRQ